ncbi:hypothetical protein Syun_025857 [Stephania yunnanensis]|uniref:Uncharacterized protein n=1 Tax=Stephania yunnanensis TaxID=152371 RepID=A0AAP0EVC8_9MAGN
MRGSRSSETGQETARVMLSAEAARTRIRRLAAMNLENYPERRIIGVVAGKDLTAAGFEVIVDGAETAWVVNQPLAPSTVSQ